MHNLDIGIANMWGATLGRSLKSALNSILRAGLESIRRGRIALYAFPGSRCTRIQRKNVVFTTCAITRYVRYRVNPLLTVTWSEIGTVVLCANYRTNTKSGPTVI